MMKSSGGAHVLRVGCSAPIAVCFCPRRKACQEMVDVEEKKLEMDIKMQKGEIIDT